MKSNAPWSIKGIDPDTRVAAKRAARQAGMTLGEWLNQQILDLSEQRDDDQQTGPAEPNIPANVVTIDQLREVVDSLNRLNERLKTTETTSRQAFSGLNEGLTSVLERVRRVERTRAEGGTDPDVLARIDHLENDGSSRKYIDSLGALEKALQQMVRQFDTTNTETLSRVSAHDEAIQSLGQRLADVDAKSAAAISGLKSHVDEVADQIRKTEATSRALMLEAKAASQSDDREFIERTSNKLRILGTEIKRSGDQISDLEGHIQKLGERVEGAEQRSAEGIGKLSARVEQLRAELTQFDEEQASMTREAQDAISATSREAQNRIAALQSSFQSMAARLDSAASESAPESTGRPVVEIDDGEAPLDEDAAAQALPEGAESDAPDEDDFDEVFGDAIDDAEAARAAEGDADDAAEIAAVLAKAAALPDDEGVEGGDAKKRPRLTAKQKVILAARARRKRLARDAQLTDEAGLADDDISAADLPESEVPYKQSAKERIAGLKEKYDSESGKRSLPVILGFILLTLLGAGAVFLLIRSPADTTSVIGEPQVISSTGAGEETLTDASAEMTADEQYQSWRTLIATASSEEEQRRALTVLKQSASRSYPPAQYDLAEDYRTGGISEQNAVMARSWYQSAAEGGNIEAMHKLGSMFARGEGGAQNSVAAVSWFERAAQFGFIDSIYNLALIFDPTVQLQDGASMEKDGETAYYWYALADKLGDPDANSDATRLGLLIDADRRREIDAEIADWTPQPPVAFAN